MFDFIVLCGDLFDCLLGVCGIGAKGVVELFGCYFDFEVIVVYVGELRPC